MAKMLAEVMRERWAQGDTETVVSVVKQSMEEARSLNGA